MRIEKVVKSNFSESIFNDLQFGRTYADHMLIAHYKNGQWDQGTIKPYAPITLSPAAQALHYGQAVFEGMKAYKSQDDEVYLFRPERNFKRINLSAERLNMPPIPEHIFMDGLKTMLDMDRAWIPAVQGMSLYVRPFIFASEEMVTARSSQEFTFMIITCPAPDYYSKPLRVKIAQKYSRAAFGGVGFAKAAGNYAASFYPTQLAKEEGFDQVIWTDSNQHKFIEEAGTMNVFVRFEDELVTAPISERILNGVTRNSVIQIAESMGIKVSEREITVEEMHNAHKNGSLKEVFGCGTAVVVNGFSAIGYPSETLELPTLDESKSYAKQIKARLTGIQCARLEDPFNWRVKVERKAVTA